MLLSNFGLLVLNNDQRPDESSSVRGYVNTVLLHVQVDAHEFLNPSSFPQEPEVADKLQRTSMDTNRLTVEVNDKVH